MTVSPTATTTRVFHGPVGELLQAMLITSVCGFQPSSGCRDADASGPAAAPPPGPPLQAGTDHVLAQSCSVGFSAGVAAV